MALFDLLKITITGGTGGSGSGSGNSFWFLGTKNLYTGDIATATGVTVAPTTDAEQPVTAVKELLGKGVLKTANALVKVDNKSYKYKIHYTSDNATTAETALVGKSMPTGKGQGKPITKVIDARRITSRS